MRRPASANYEELEAVIAEVRAFCVDKQVEAVDGSQTDADTIWPSEILAILDNGARAERPPYRPGGVIPAGGSVTLQPGEKLDKRTEFRPD